MICGDLWKHFSSVKVIRFLKKVFGLLENDQDEQETLKQIEVLEKISFRLIITRRGHQQDRIGYVHPYFHLHNNLIRFVVIVQIIRLITLIKYTDNGDIQVYLGSPLYNLPDRNILLGLAFFLAITLFILREYIFYMEDHGAFNEFLTLRDIRINGFDRRRLRLTDCQCKLFRSLFHFLINFWNRFTISCCVFIPLFLTLIRILNVEFRNGSSSLFICSIFWTILEVHTFLFIASGLLYLESHITILIPLYLCQLNSVIELCDKYKRKPKIDDYLIKELDFNFILFMNKFEQLMIEVRYLLFFIFFIVSFIADTLVFIGAIVKLSAIFISNACALVGVFALVIIGGATYATGVYVSKVITIFSKLYFAISYKRVYLLYF